MPTSLAKRGTTRAVAAAARKPAVLPDTGVVTAIAAVTGVEDSVNDIIVPGAFTATLRKLNPKLCWMHQWTVPLGSVLSVVELRPGDPRLPKTLPNGKPWPKEAGALVARLQFNLNTFNGREFYEHCKLWAKTGEAAFSIGYRVPDGQASKRADGVRLIYGLDLYEISLVLHGAHPLALGLEVKNADGQQLEYKGSGGLGIIPEVKAARAAVMEAKAGVPGIADTPSDHAAVARLRRSWSHGTMAAKIGWGTEGDFMRCVALATEHMGPEDAKGWCNLRHHDALGMYPATHHKLATEGKALPKTQKCARCDSSATKRIIHADGRAYVPTCDEHEATVKQGLDDVVDVRPIETKSAAAAVLEAKAIQPTPEVKSMPRIRGSYEELRSMLSDQLDDLLTPKNEKGERSGYMNIDATFDDVVIATVTDYGSDLGVSYRVPFSKTGEGVELGTPAKVELSVIVTDGGTSGPAETGDAVRMRFIDPASLSIKEATRFVQAVPEGKGVEALSPAVLELVDALAVKGYDLARAVGGQVGDDMWSEDEDMPSEHDRYTGQRKEFTPDLADDPEQDEYGDSDADDYGDGYEDYDGDDGGGMDPESDPNEAEPDSDPDDGEEADPNEAEPDADEDDERITLDPEDVQQQMADLRA